MVIRRMLERTLKLFNHFFYRGPVYTFAKQSGIDSQLRDIYWSGLLWASNPASVAIDTTSAKFCVSTQTEYQRIKGLMDEETVLEDLLRKINDDDIFYDIGANIGIYSCLIGKKLSRGQVVAFEPHQATADRLKTNLALNNVEADIHRTVLSDEDGPVEFSPSGDSLGSGTHSISAGGTDNTTTVQSTTGNRVAEQSGSNPTVLKIDVEGAELQVLRGLSEVLDADSCRLIYCEVHPDGVREFGGDPRQIPALLRNHGYDVEQIYRRQEEWFIRASL